MPVNVLHAYPKRERGRLVLRGVENFEIAAGGSERLVELGIVDVVCSEHDKREVGRGRASLVVGSCGDFSRRRAFAVGDNVGVLRRGGQPFKRDFRDRGVLRTANRQDFRVELFFGIFRFEELRRSVCGGRVETRPDGGFADVGEARHCGDFGVGANRRGEQNGGRCGCFHKITCCRPRRFRPCSGRLRGGRKLCCLFS